MFAYGGFSNEVFNDLFKMIDGDGNGFLDRDEMFKFIKDFDMLG